MNYEKYEKSFGEFIEDVVNGVKFYHLEGVHAYECTLGLHVILETLKDFYNNGNLHTKKEVTLEDYLAGGGEVLVFKDGKYGACKGEYYEGDY